MATQRLTIASIAGKARSAVQALYRSWRDGHAAFNPAAVDRFCEQLRANGTALPIVYFGEWMDRWLMGDTVPGPSAVEGRRYQTACLTRSEAVEWANHLGNQVPEQEWLAARLREAVTAWESVAEPLVIVITREVLGPTTTDEEVQAALQEVPDWFLSEFNHE